MWFFNGCCKRISDQQYAEFTLDQLKNRKHENENKIHELSAHSSPVTVCVFAPPLCLAKTMSKPRNSKELEKQIDRLRKENTKITDLIKIKNQNCNGLSAWCNLVIRLDSFRE